MDSVTRVLDAMQIVAAAMAVTVGVIASPALSAERAIPEAAVTFLGVTAGSTDTLKTVIGRLGVAKQWHTGDASASEWKICYKIGEGSDRVIIVFASNSEMSSPKGQVTDIRIYGPRSSFAAQHRCSAIADPGELRTANGVGLDASSQQIFEALWKRPASKRGSLHYESCRKRYLERSSPYFSRWAGKSGCGFENPQRPYENDCSTIDIQLQNDSAVLIRLGRGQSIC